MAVFYGIIFGLFVLLGIFRLQSDPGGAIHNFLIALYFFVVLFGILGKPFSRPIYLFVAVLLLADAGLQFYSRDVLSGVISLLFAYFAFNDRNRFGTA